mgnify:CR=1 FL=1
MITYLQRIEWFIGLVLLQVLVLNRMHMNGYATPFFFIYFIPANSYFVKLTFLIFCFYKLVRYDKILIR